MKDYYKILQIDPEAEPEVIQGAYRRLARKYHPNVDGSPEAAVRVKELKEAYAVLSDAAKRADYDQQRGAQASGKHLERSTAFKTTARTRRGPNGIAQAVLDRGALFTRPYGFLAGLVYPRAQDYTAALKKVKALLDPSDILAPGRLCF